MQYGMSRIVIVILAILMLAPISNPAAAASAHYFYDFQRTLAPWKSASDRGIKSQLERREDDDACYGVKPGGYAHLKSTLLYGQEVPDPVGSWIQASFPGYSPSSHISVEWSARSIVACEGCIAMVYVGTTSPTVAGNFHPILRPLTTYWQTFHYDVTLPVGATDKVYVALGWLGGDAAIGLDCVRVQITL